MASEARFANRLARWVRFEKRFRQFAVSFSMALRADGSQEYDWHRWPQQQRCRSSPLEHKALRTDIFLRYSAHFVEPEKLQE